VAVRQRTHEDVEQRSRRSLFGSQYVVDKGERPLIGEHSGASFKLVPRVRCGAEGLDRLKSGSRPCVILLDLIIPLMDGCQFRAKQLTEPDLAQLPVILSATTEIRRHAAELNAAGCVSKPFLLDRLLNVVQRYCWG
jgi:CheY-like chemotaxis protein